ncbi:MAG: MFS transporter [Pseudomonadota bacterium]
MSVVVVVRKGDRAVMAADTQTSDGSIVLSAEYITNHEKIVTFGDSYFGFAGWSASQEIMQSVMRNHPDKLDFSTREAVFETARSIHGLLKKEYFLETQEDEKDQPVESSQLSMLVAGPRGIFELESYRAVSEYKRFWAIGSGRRFAIGAMYAVYDQLADPLAIARVGIEAACQFDDGCSLPMTHHEASLASSLTTD